MDHDFSEFELLVLFISNVLGNHSNTLAFTSHASTPVESVTIIVVVLAIQGTDSRGLPNASIALSASLVVLPSEVERLQE